MRKIVFSFLFFLVILEIGIRLSGRLKTYTEKNFDTYQSVYDTHNLDHLFIWKKNDTIISKETEFNYSYITNSYGLIDRHLLDTCNRNYTTIFLGDSFVSGSGSPQDSSLPVLLSSKMNANIINAGIPGSDLFYQQVLIDSIFKPKGFDKYIFMVNVSDLYDYVIRGGEERFLENNKVEYKEKPWFEPIYQYSYLFRAIIHMGLQTDYSLLSKAEMERLKWKAVTEYINLFKNIAKENEIIVVLQPYARQYGKNKKLLGEVLNYSYLDSIEIQLKSNNIKTINLDLELKKRITSENYLEYSWELDGHFNSKGYELLSQLISKELKSKPNLFFTKDY